MSCTTILVGKKASYDGSTIISRNDDGNFEPKKVIVVKPENQPRKYNCVISHLEIDLPDNPMRYTAVPSVNTKYGLWAACGINEANVGMTATETITSNARVLGADPYVVYKKEPKNDKKDKKKDNEIFCVTPEYKMDKKKDKDFVETVGGIGEEDLVILTLPYIKTAKEGVLRVAELLEKYGTYEPNGMAFNDENEVWWLETIGGHHWIAKRVPDDKVVIMPNQFGLDNFDFDDAYGAQKENMCSKDLKEFVEKNHLYLGSDDKVFNPRLAFGSRSDADHLYNTPRAWYLGRYFNPRTYKWDGIDADFRPDSDDIPWSLVPERKVTIEDIKYILSSFFQGTPYNPYSKGDDAGKYRTIGVPNTDVSGIIQIRGYMPDRLKGIEWLTLGGANFTCSFPIYTSVNSMPKYISETPLDVSTNHLYWSSRILASLVDAHFPENIVFSERYQNAVFNKSREIQDEYDNKMLKDEKLDLTSECNEKVVAMVKKETDEVLLRVLNTSSNLMKTRFHRSDN